MNSSYTKN